MIVNRTGLDMAGLPIILRSSIVIFLASTQIYHLHVQDCKIYFRVAKSKFRIRCDFGRRGVLIYSLVWLLQD
jgi:hypothetical protein